MTSRAGAPEDSPHPPGDEAVGSSEERLRMVIENAREYAIFTLDCDRRITSWNTGAQRVLGYTEAEAIGRPADMIFTPEERAACVPQAEAALALREGRAGDDRNHQRKDGSLFWASGILMAMRNSAGRVVGFVKILRDQTEMRLTQLALERSQAELAQSLREKEAASAAKDQFLAVLSHELRTPLTPAVTALQLLARRNDLPDDVRAMLELILRNIRIESHLIDDLLDITRISRGTYEVVREPVNLNEVIQGALDICEPDVKAKSQRLHLRLEAAHVQTLGDRHRLQQVVWNLLKNASKFTPSEGEIRLLTRTEGDRFLMELSDTGAGIDPEALPHIFEPFAQGGTWVAREFGGLGLGLAISKATVDALGGHLHASSPGRGHGSVFTLELPLAA